MGYIFKTSVVGNFVYIFSTCNEQELRVIQSSLGKPFSGGCVIIFSEFPIE